MTKKLIAINNKEILFSYNDSQYWIAIKPICEALDINYDRQYQNIIEDDILGQLYAKQHIVAKDNRLREMICLPEKYIYGWIFSLNSKSVILLEYKKKCYDILYNYFHSEIVRRAAELKQKTLLDIEIEKLEAELKESELYQSIEALKSTRKIKVKNLSDLDKQYVATQLELWTK